MNNEWKILNDNIDSACIFILKQKDMNELKLFMVMLGCKPPGRFTEQHDIFFGIATSLKELVSQMNLFWKEADGKIHIDAWREVTQLNNYAVKITEKETHEAASQKEKLFFINLGGYKENEFEEYHYKIIMVAADKGEAIRSAKQTAFYKHVGFAGAESHIDDKYGIDVDDVYEIEEILSADIKEKYGIALLPAANNVDDELHIGYTKIDKLLKRTF
ncbi:MAG: DUF1543 domain-containing protein [Parafilimonas sp.]